MKTLTMSTSTPGQLVTGQNASDTVRQVSCRVFFVQAQNVVADTAMTNFIKRSMSDVYICGVRSQVCSYCMEK